MELTGIFCPFLLLPFFITGLAAESPSDLTCNVIQQPDGSFMYRLSRQPRSPTCEASWEDRNNTVIARSPANISTLDPRLVLNLTNQVIIMKDCWDYLLHTRDCLEGFEEARCKVNCGTHLNKDPGHSTMSSTLTCIFRSVCPDRVTVLISILVPAVILLAVAFVGLCSWKRYKRRRSTASTASYTCANQQSKMERVEIDRRMDIV